MKISKFVEEVIFTPAVRRYKMPNPRVKYVRYPSPASEPINHDENQMDYKTAFRDSIHQIRYHKDLLADQETESFHYVQDAYGDSVQDKLVKFGFLSRSEAEDPDAVAKAKEQYEQEMGEPVEQIVHYDELGLSDKPITRDNRESVAHFVRSFLTANRDINAEENFNNSLEDVYNPHIIHFKTLDMFDEPVYRQLRVDLHYQVELYTQKKEVQGYMPVFKGDPKFWNILDNSFSPEQIKATQNAIKDHSQDDLGQLALRHNSNEYHGTDRIEYPIRNNMDMA
ncbi:hypothetical protein PPERSA_01591 [Pseudocohnilembus persalinus]|uniref:Uncharacterized protein n=1 Tax=Pseudocohnilembus persalinus TaxID=266149 RepID=A0A0V0QHK1_PSEPJ|nr:hypothetical protein PPERSA_01591 [Pseudocohnilembus persalinus]|eukprot:KRX01721.1 hypothetical protein PPERSA_01591 [Pseudocohnilembus persalinus]